VSIILDRARESLTNANYARAVAKPYPYPHEIIGELINTIERLQTCRPSHVCTCGRWLPCRHCEAD